MITNNVAYLLSLVDVNNAEIRDTWAALGSLTIDSTTKRYIKDTFFKVQADSGELAGALVYCTDNYIVNDTWPVIDWSTITIQDTEGRIGAVQGVESPFFRVILTGEKVAAIAAEVNKDIAVFSGVTTSSNINIADNQLIMLLTECGVPFLQMSELEYDKYTILEYMIRPTLDTFYSFFPIVKDESIGSYSAGASFKKEFPADTWGAIPYYVLGTAGSSASYGSGAFSLYREQMMCGGGGGGSGFGTGLSYRKNVPGWVGLQNKDAALQALQAAQGYINYFRREHVKVVRENKKQYVEGYSTVGGNVNIKWLKYSYDWDDIPFSFLTQVRNLAKANIMRNLGMLRAMVKSDTPGTIDFSLYNTRADALEGKVLPKWESSATNYDYSIMRGGL